MANHMTRPKVEIKKKSDTGIGKKLPTTEDHYLSIAIDTSILLIFQELHRRIVAHFICEFFTLNRQEEHSKIKIHFPKNASL